MSDPNAAPSSEPLQFDRAEDADQAPAAGAAPAMDCSSCNTPIRSYYYHVDGNAVCARCKQTAERAGKSQHGFGAFVRAFVVGGVAAVIGAAIYYGVIAITNFEIGLVALLIGFMVGFGVRFGARGAGGRRYQVLAVALTYFAVGLAYMPLFLKGAKEAAESVAEAPASSLAMDSAAVAEVEEEQDPSGAEAADSGTVALAAESPDSLPARVTRLGQGSFTLGAVIVAGGAFLMIFALPVLAIIGSMPSGLISALIIGFGMQQAWKMTAGHIVSISGPYRVGPGQPPPPDAAPAPAS